MKDKIITTLTWINFLPFMHDYWINILSDLITVPIIMSQFNIPAYLQTKGFLTIVSMTCQQPSDSAVFSECVELKYISDSSECPPEKYAAASCSG